MQEYAGIKIRRKCDRDENTMKNFSLLKDRIGTKTRESNEGIYIVIEMVKSTQRMILGKK